jgi:hypothetical protein
MNNFNFSLTLFYRALTDFRNDKAYFWNINMMGLTNNKINGMKSKITLFAASFAILLASSSFSFGPVDDVAFQNDEFQQKEKNVKVVVQKDGKTTQIDTTFTSVGGELPDAKIDSILKEFDVAGGGKEMERIVMIGGPDKMVWQDKKGVTQFSGDSIKVMVISKDSLNKHFETKVMQLDKDGERVIFINRGDGNMMPPMPPFPAHRPVMIHREFRDRFAFDPNDENIVSYDRKDVGKDMEKITIVRKKVKVENKDEEVKVEVEVEDAPDDVLTPDKLDRFFKKV